MRNGVKNIFRSILLFQNFHIYLLDYARLIKKSYQLRFRNGLKLILRGKTNDKSMVREIFLSKDYFRGAVKISDGDIVCDVGANIGFFTLFAATQYPTSKVFSFEPNQENFEIFTRSIELNGVMNVVAVNTALGNEKGTFKLYHSHNTGGHSLVNQSQFMERNKLEMHDFEEVKVESFRDFFNASGINRIDFLKMDIEGGEYDILLNLKDSDYKKIGKIAMEYHFVDSKRNGEVLKELFINHGYTVEMHYPMLWAIRNELL